MIPFTAASRYGADVFEQALDALVDTGLPRDPNLIALIDGDGWSDEEGSWPYRLVLTAEGKALHAESPGIEDSRPADAGAPHDPREGRL